MNILDVSINQAGVQIIIKLRRNESKKIIQNPEGRWAAIGKKLKKELSELTPYHKLVQVDINGYQAQLSFEG